MDVKVGPETAVHSTSILKIEQKPLPTVHLLPDASHPSGPDVDTTVKVSSVSETHEVYLG